jgi:hypothetical protein
MKAKSTKLFTPGQPVLVREIWHGQLWTARPEIVVQDTSELLALYIPRGAHWKQARSFDDKKVSTLSRKTGEWKLADTIWQGEGRLRLAVPGSQYSVLAFWNDNHTALNCWYINLEDPLTRTARGFDYMDQLLDIIVEPDLKNWHWKDEDEFQEAIDLGLIPPQQAKMFRAEGEKALKLLQSGNSIYNSWEYWQPDPSWQVPVLPEGWEMV